MYEVKVFTGGGIKEAAVIFRGNNVTKIHS
jgi:hypothetical protein